MDVTPVVGRGIGGVALIVARQAIYVMDRAYVDFARPPACAA
jgi:hypothetical protein